MVVCLLHSYAFAQVIIQTNTHKQVALTFDDGPSSKFTPKILDTLKKYHIKATFFVTGRRIEENPKILKRMADEGHEIGNHTYYHTSCDYLNYDELILELKMTSKLIKKITGLTTHLFRPPHGKISYQMRTAIQNTGYDIVLWTVHADDFARKGYGIRDATSIVKRVLALTYGGDIIIMHDNSQQIVDALPRIVKYMQEHDFQFVTISQLKPTRLGLNLQ